MHHVPFARLDAEDAASRLEDALEFVDDLKDDLAERAWARDMFVHQCIVAAAGHHLRGEAQQASTMLALAARTSRDLIVAEPQARAWIDAMWLALAIGDRATQRALSAVPLDRLSPPGVAFAPHALPMVRLLASLVTRDGSHGAAMIATLEAMSVDDEVAATLRDHTEALELPPLRTLAALFADDAARFAVELGGLLDRHAKYHAEGGFGAALRAHLSFPACALRRLAHERGWAPAVTSEYMPAWVWR